MYLKRMKILEGIGESKEIRDVHFKLGLNIIVDDSSNNGKGNNVGKTSFLKLIDLCLGAQDKKYIWTDSDTGSETTSLKNYINNKRVYVELEIGNEKSLYTLKVELFERGRRYINNEPFPYTAYVEELNYIFFNIKKPPSFRQLIGKFVRIKQKEDTNTILKYLHQNTTNAEYKNIYDYLFKLSSQENSKRKLGLYNVIEQIKKDINQIIKLHKFSNVDDLNERIRIVRTTTNELDIKVNAMINVKEYERNLGEITQIKNRINTLNDLIEAALYKKTKFLTILSKENANNDAIDESMLLEFYQDVERSMGDVSKEFNELIEFNNSIKQNKVTYYSNRLNKIDSEISEMTRLRESIINENKKVISIIDEDNFQDFENIHKELIAQSEQLGVLTKVLEIYNDLTSELINKTKEYEEISGNSDSFDNLSRFNEYLTKYSYEVFGQRLYLTRENSFPLKLSNVDDGLGTGYRKSITLLLDIAYVSFINELKLNYPKFFVHDVLETVDEHNLGKIVEFINGNESQFIFAILNEKVKNYSFIKDTDKILRLSKDSKLFGI
jgi:uncharacterized protein YydD (DUF2326 family)